MKPKLKVLSEQVVVITGASSGIGLVTSRAAARGGAKLVVAARDEESLAQLVDEVGSRGGRAVYVVADVARERDVQRIAEPAAGRFGGFDTWVNNAAVSIYGRLEEVSMEDQRRLFDTNFWGTVHGSRVAVAHLRERGGALINVGSVLSDRAIPLQGTYCASKHAVKGFTDALRMELEEDGAPVSVTLIKPGAIDTPYRLHAKNYMKVEPKNPPPVYAPELVAKAILHCAQHPVRDLIVGGGGRALVAMGTRAPRLLDRIMERVMGPLQRTDRPAADRGDAGLRRPSGRLAERGGYPGHVRERSVYTAAAMHPALTGAAVVGALVGVAALARAGRGVAGGWASRR